MDPLWTLSRKHHDRTILVAAAHHSTVKQQKQATDSPTEEVANPELTDFTHNSRKAWKTINTMLKDCTQPKQKCKVTTDQVAHQFLLNEKGYSTHLSLKIADWILPTSCQHLITMDPLWTLSRKHHDRTFLVAAAHHSTVKQQKQATDSPTEEVANPEPTDFTHNSRKAWKTINTLLKDSA